MLNGEDIPEPQPHLHPTDHQPMIIEQYRGPLLDQLREQEAEAKLMPLADGSRMIRHEQAMRYTTHYWIIRAVANLQSLCNRVSAGWRLLTAPFGAGDDVLDWARIGTLFQLICVAVLILYALVIQLLPYQFMSPLLLTLLFSIPKIIVLPFYLVGLFNSTRAAVLYRRARHPHVALALGLIPYIALAIIILLIVSIFK